MSREEAIAAVAEYFDDGGFERDLARRVAIPTESQNPERRTELYRYLQEEMTPSFEKLGFSCRILENPNPKYGPFLLAERIEDPDLVTVMSYGHGDVIRGQDAQWRDGLAPWRLTFEGERVYGRGTADNKGQHSINLGGVAAALKTRGRLGFNMKVLIETGEETGSPGLRELCESRGELFAADVFIASDGPRLAPSRPTVFLGSRGSINFNLTVDLREGGHHSGNWGGLLANPGIILAHALATITSPTGAIRVREWVPAHIPNSVRVALADCVVEGGEGAPEIDPGWGEPGLTPAEKVFGWCSFEVLAFRTGNPENPVNAIPPRASAHSLMTWWWVVARLRPGRSGSSSGDVTSCEYFSDFDVSGPVRRRPPSGPAPTSSPPSPEPAPPAWRASATAWTSSSLRMSDAPETPASVASSRSSATFVSRSSVSLTSGVFGVWLPGCSAMPTSWSSRLQRAAYPVGADGSRLLGRRPPRLSARARRLPRSPACAHTRRRSRVRGRRRASRRAGGRTSGTPCASGGTRGSASRRTHASPGCGADS